MAFGLRRLAGLAIATGFAGAIFFGDRTEAETGKESASIVVELVGLPSDEGGVELCVHDRKTMEKSNLQKKDDALSVLRTNIPIRGRVGKWTSPPLPVGDYALLVYHDENRNGKCDLRLLGSERVGASGYEKPMMGYPKFDKASFPLTSTGAKVIVRLMKPGIPLLPPY